MKINFQCYVSNGMNACSRLHPNFSFYWCKLDSNLWRFYRLVKTFATVVRQFPNFKGSNWSLIQSSGWWCIVLDSLRQDTGFDDMISKQRIRWMILFHLSRWAGPGVWQSHPITVCRALDQRIKFIACKCKANSCDSRM